MLTKISWPLLSWHNILILLINNNELTKQNNKTKSLTSRDFTKQNNLTKTAFTLIVLTKISCNQWAPDFLAVKLLAVQNFKGLNRSEFHKLLEFSSTISIFAKKGGACPPSPPPCAGLINEYWILLINEWWMLLRVPLHISLPPIDQRKTHCVYPKRGEVSFLWSSGNGGKGRGHECKCVLG